MRQSLLSLLAIGSKQDSSQLSLPESKQNRPENPGEHEHWKCLSDVGIHVPPLRHGFVTHRPRGSGMEVVESGVVAGAPVIGALVVDDTGVVIVFI